MFRTMINTLTFVQVECYIYISGCEQSRDDHINDSFELLPIIVGNYLLTNIRFIVVTQHIITHSYRGFIVTFYHPCFYIFLEMFPWNIRCLMFQHVLRKILTKYAQNPTQVITAILNLT